jgi:hypothetical protein
MTLVVDKLAAGTAPKLKGEMASEGMMVKEKPRQNRNRMIRPFNKIEACGIGLFECSTKPQQWN